MYTRYTLRNGIKVIAEYIPYVNSISMGVWIRSGSRYENSQNNGVSHFIEHMLFKGTKNRSAKRIAEEIEEVGGQINAFTGKEATCFYVKLLDEHIGIGIDVLSDMLLNSNFSEDDIQREKGVIQEEINMYEDSPEDLVVDILSLGTWGKDTLAYPILGTEKTVNSFNREIVLDYFSNIYTPNNIVISIAGNYNEKEIIKILEDKFGSYSSEKNSILSVSKPAINNEVIIRKKDIEQIHVTLSFKGIELGNDRLYTLLALNNYFGGGTSSRLFQSLREEKGYVYTIYSFPSSYQNAGVFNIYFALNGQYIDNAMELIHNEILDTLNNKLDDVQIKKAKEQLKGNYILGLESVSSRMFGMGKSELMLNRVNEPKEILDKIDKITSDDVHKTIEDVFKGGILSAAAVGRNISEDKFKSLIWR